jgi:two-component system, cell cycle response regulator DivK
MESHAALSFPDWKGKTILIVEDELTNYLFIEAAIERTGAKLIWAKDGQNGVELFTQNPDINVVLMDIKLPVMNGMEATRQIMAKNPKIPVIALTAYALTGQKEEILESGCCDYLSKPIRHQFLLTTIAKWI